MIATMKQSDTIIMITIIESTKIVALVSMTLILTDVD